MADYIDRKKLIPDRCYYEPYGFDAVSCEQIDSQPTADVVERSEYDKLEKEYNHYKRLAEQNAELRIKINEAIEDIENEIKFWTHLTNYQEPLEVQRNKQAKANSYGHALEILKNNIGK